MDNFPPIVAPLVMAALTAAVGSVVTEGVKRLFKKNFSWIHGAYIGFIIGLIGFGIWHWYELPTIRVEGSRDAAFERLRDQVDKSRELIQIISLDTIALDQSAQVEDYFRVLEARASDPKRPLRVQRILWKTEHLDELLAWPDKYRSNARFEFAYYPTGSDRMVLPSVIIDRDHVHFGLDHLGGSLEPVDLETTDPRVIEAFKDYFSDLWTASTILKDGDTPLDPDRLQELRRREANQSLTALDSKVLAEEALALVHQRLRTGQASPLSPDHLGRWILAEHGVNEPAAKTTRVSLKKTEQWWMAGQEGAYRLDADGVTRFPTRKTEIVGIGQEDDHVVLRGKDGQRFKVVGDVAQPIPATR